MNEELKLKIKNIKNEIIDNVVSDIDPELDFENVMIDLIMDRLSNDDLNGNRVSIEKYIRSIV